MKVRQLQPRDKAIKYLFFQVHITKAAWSWNHLDKHEILSCCYSNILHAVVKSDSTDKGLLQIKKCWDYHRQSQSVGVLVAVTLKFLDQRETNKITDNYRNVSLTPFQAGYFGCCESQWVGFWHAKF